VSFDELNAYLVSVSSKTLPEEEGMADALLDIQDLHTPRPELVSDYRGPTLRDQLLKLVDERSRLANMLLKLAPDARRSGQGREIREALDFVDREIIRKKRWHRTLVDNVLGLPGKD
jgi:hypothetical protein